MSEQTEPEKESKPQRRGDTQKCPVCGSHVDAEAYYCPTCHNAFCYHCRARLVPSDAQLECVNQACAYYAKLICGTCASKVEQEAPPAVYLEPEEGYWPGFLLLVLLAGLIVWVWQSFLWALLVVLCTFGVGGYLLHSLGLNIFGRERRVEHQRKSQFHQCICCHQRLRRLRLKTHS